MMGQVKKGKNIRKKIFWESIFVMLIALSPFIYKLYDYLPEDPNATFSLFGISVDKHGFADISTFMWFLMSKIVPLYLLFFWFMTAKNWWYHIILIPIAMYSFQIFEVLFTNDNDIDTENLLWLLPVCMVVIPFVYFARIKLYDKYVHGIDLEAMEAELNSLRDKQKKSKAEKENNSLIQEKPRYRTLSEKIEYGLSTQNIERKLKKIQHGVKNLLHF